MHEALCWNTCAWPVSLSFGLTHSLSLSYFEGGGRGEGWCAAASKPSVRVSQRSNHTPPACVQGNGPVLPHNTNKLSSVQNSSSYLVPGTCRPYSGRTH